MSLYPTKPKKTLTISRDEAHAALQKLREEWQAADKSLCLFIKRLQWFRDWQAYKYFGYSTFESFIKGEMGYSRKWLWEHLKTLPVIEKEKRLLTSDKCPPGGCENSEKPHLDAENESDGKLGNCNNDRLKLSHKQRLEVAKLPYKEREKAIKTLLDECPGGNLKATRELLQKAMGNGAKKIKPIDDLPDALKKSPLDPLRAALREALEYFSALYDMDDAKLTKAASSVFEYCRRINKAAKAI